METSRKQEGAAIGACYHDCQHYYGRGLPLSLRYGPIGSGAVSLYVSNLLSLWLKSYDQCYGSLSDTSL